MGILDAVDAEGWYVTEAFITFIIGPVLRVALGIVYQMRNSLVFRPSFGPRVLVPTCLLPESQHLICNHMYVVAIHCSYVVAVLSWALPHAII